MEVTPEQAEAFATLLRSAREGRGWLQLEAAKRAGVAASTLSRLEHAPYEGMRFEDIMRLCWLYGISPEQVASIVGIPTSGDRQEVDGELTALCAVLQGLEQEQRTFVLKVLHAIIRGM